jgi:Undecaprenyl-phosphate glucose phosphotransferase
VLVGGGPEAAGVLDAMHEAGGDDIRVVGLFDDRTGARSPDMVRGVPKLGGVADLVPFARRAHLDLVIIAFPLTATARIGEVAELLRVLPVDIRLSGYTRSVTRCRRRAPQVTGDRLIALANRPLAGAAALSKRALDIGVAAPALVACSPLMLLIAAAIRLDSPGPVFFRQRRHGYNHSEIEILKFRSMHADATDAGARRVVRRDDPRVTRVGRVLRRCSLDELPQLINVLRGELSLVGPRPHVVDAVYSERTPFEEIVDGYAARHRVPPGITGWAQINGWRGEIDNPERLLRRVEHDLYYIENRTLWFDLYILMRTLPALFRSGYAY